MNKIQVAILNEAHTNPAGMTMFLAMLTQRGHNISNMGDLLKLYDNQVQKTEQKNIKSVMALPHGTIKRFAPITIAIVGASRRFLAQARTNQVGIDYLSASLQYSDYSDSASFVVPYEILTGNYRNEKAYLDSCNTSLETYSSLIDNGVSNDVAGYAMPQGLRNILIMQGNHQSWDYFIRLRSCNRNTNETQYVACLIWELLRKESKCGEDMFSAAGPDCCYGVCREGSMSCKNPILQQDPTELINLKWSLLK